VFLSLDRRFTSAGAAFVVDAFQGLVSLGDMRWHGSGTSSTVESSSDTRLDVEVGARFSGTQTENGATVYRTVGTVIYSITATITEHGLFDSDTGGTLLDRSVFTGIPVTTNDRIVFTFDVSVIPE
jgi:hypothetical protein